MRLYYKKHLASYAKELRKAGNLSEVLLWNELKGNKLGCRFLRQRPIASFIVDFYCSALNLAVEIDGATTHDNKMEKDVIRQKQLESLGVRIIRFKDAGVRYNLSGVMQNIENEILRLTSSPPPLKKEE